MRRLILLLIMAAMFSMYSNGQIVDPIEVARQKSEERANSKIDEGIDAGFDKIEEGIGNLFNKKKKDKTVKNEDKEDDNADGNHASEPEDETPEVAKPVSSPAIQTYSKFDFVPGDKIIFFDDFASDPVGEFPAKWNTNNNAEVVTVGSLPGKWLRLPVEGGNYFPGLNLDFPENVTIEFDVLASDQTEFGFTYYSEEACDLDAYGVPGDAGFELGIFVDDSHNFSNYANSDSGNGMAINTSSTKGRIAPNQQAHISVWVQKSRMRMYVNEEKAFDIPKGVFPGYVYNRMRFVTTNTRQDVLVSNIRIAVGAPDTRNQLITTGKFTTHGILFDVNSDKIKPESHGCIKDIADVLKENPTVNVMIIGHTDSDGSDASNLDLSKRRAASVKNYLAQQFGIEAGRMETDGKGETQPVDSNSTPEGKANNRRVEFIKK
jgi:outer membrane protein OmpA-like peptidoglycan-associated protein